MFRQVLIRRLNGIAEHVVHEENRIMLLIEAMAEDSVLDP
jgi:hypothetical protein